MEPLFGNKVWSTQFYTISKTIDYPEKFLNIRVWMELLWEILQKLVSF